MKVETLLDIINADFFTGVPDSQLTPLCNYLMYTYGIDPMHHIIAANEGNSVALAAGYHLATGKVPVVYMQNSGEGNVINPITSLLNDEVYAIPCIFIVGWRGEPGTHDEPQHVYQGKVTVKLLEDLDIDSFIVNEQTTKENLEYVMSKFSQQLANGKQVAFIIGKGALSYSEKVTYANSNQMVREDIIRYIVKVAGNDPIISTTGKASRELFEIRTANNQSHQYDFLTVGSMGHSSSIALGIALNKPERKIWCVDGDGALLMHMGSMGVIGHFHPSNLVHIVINNSAHETVGGMPTVTDSMDLPTIAKGCGYPYAVSVSTFEDLVRALHAAKERKELSFIEAKCSIGARNDLGRPSTSARENKENFMSFLHN